MANGWWKTPYAVLLFVILQIVILYAIAALAMRRNVNALRWYCQAQARSGVRPRFRLGDASSTRTLCTECCRRLFVGTRYERLYQPHRGAGVSDVVDGRRGEPVHEPAVEED